MLIFVHREICANTVDDDGECCTSARAGLSGKKRLSVMPWRGYNTESVLVVRSLRTVALACAELGVRVEFDRDMRSLPVRYCIVFWVTV